MTCPFCNMKGKMDNVIIKKGELWYAFVPKTPEIFGHIITTYSDKGVHCIRNIWEDYGEFAAIREKNYKNILNSMMEGVRIMSNKMLNIDNVKRYYIAMLGEDSSVHIHFHLFPRYEFLNNDEIAKWAKNNGLGEEGWKLFYSYPTKNFKFFRGFNYLGEIERKYNDWKWYQMENKDPKPELLKEMKDKLIEMLDL
jgi:diadenosine tetraphosphate (Ap4A) HIT family hydrolase